MQDGNYNEVPLVTIDHNRLPIHIVFEGKDGKREYVLKTNGDHSKLLLNKKEY